MKFYLLLIGILFFLTSCNLVNNEIKEIDYPNAMIEESDVTSKNIKFSKNGKNYTLKFITETSYTFNSTDLEELDIGYKNFFILNSDIQVEPKNRYDDKGNIFHTNHIFYKMPDGKTALYQLEIPFIEEGEYTYRSGGMQEQEIMNYTSSDGKEITLGTYSYLLNSSCGDLYTPNGAYKFEASRVGFMKGISYAESRNIPDEELIIRYSNEDLVESGNMRNDEIIYSFKDKNHRFLKGMYDYGYYAQLDDYGCLDENSNYQVNDEGCVDELFLSYDEYINAIPIFFWKDPFDRYIMFIDWSTRQPFMCGHKTY